MAIIDKITESERKANERAIATKILDKMESLRLENDENSSKRWIWELLQNAKDCAVKNQKVKVNINFDKNRGVLEFSHNGQSFSPENLTFLIKQVSTKERSESDSELKTTGKFGTGFLSTHLLSEIVELEGVIADEDISPKSFQLTLDRSGKDILSVLNAIDKTFKQLSQIDNSEPIKNFNQSELNTKFSYKLDTKGLAIAEQGLRDFKACIFYVLIFIGNIYSIKLEHENKEYILSDKTVNLSETLKQYIIIERTLNKAIEHEIIVITDNEVSVAMPIVCKGNTISFDISKEKSAKLFCDFPLVGTENFCFPAVVNSSNFNPTEPRDGIYLTDKNDSKIIENKTLMIKARSLLYDLIDFASTNNWQRMFALAQFSKTFEAKWIDDKWLKEELIDLIIEKLLTTPIVDTVNKNRSAIKDAENWNVWFPHDEKSEIREMIWNLYSDFAPGILPVKDEIHEWYESVLSRETKLNIKEAFVDVTDRKNIEELTTKLKNNKNVFEWLNYFYAMVEKSKNEDFFNKDEFQVLPNQNGEFIHKNSLKLDEGIEDRVKDALLLLKVDIRNSLIHKNIKLFEKLKFVVLTQTEVVNDINNILKHNSEINKTDACELLLASFPSIKTEMKEREQLYSFYLKLNKSFEQIEKQHLSNWSDDIWEESDKIIVKQIATKISEFENIEALSKKVLFSEQETVQWIDAFIDYLVKNNFTVIDSKTISFLPNQNGCFCVKDDLYLDDGEIDESLKDICAELGYDFRDKLLDERIFLKMPEASNADEKQIANKIIELAQDLLHRHRNEEEKKTLRKLIIWFSENAVKAGKLFGEFYSNKHKIYEDKEIAESFQKWEETTALMEELGVSSLRELKKIIEGVKHEGSFTIEKSLPNNVSIEQKDITREDLLQYGITTREELEKAFEVREFAEKFKHQSTPSFEMFEYAQKLIDRAKENIKNYLVSLEAYDCTDMEELASTIIAGIKKKGVPITVVVRPSDFGQVLFYYSSEKDALDYENAELWVEDGKTEPKLLTLGKILKATGINRIPIKELRE